VCDDHGGRDVPPATQRLPLQTSLMTRPQTLKSIVAPLRQSKRRALSLRRAKATAGQVSADCLGVEEGRRCLRTMDAEVAPTLVCVECGGLRSEGTPVAGGCSSPRATRRRSTALCVRGRGVRRTLRQTTIESIPIERPTPTAASPQALCLDRRYDYNEVRELTQQLGFTAHIRGRGEEAQASKREAGFRARRWVVEPTHSWLNRFRRILTRWEKRADTYLATLRLACGLITRHAANWEPLPESALSLSLPLAFAEGKITLDLKLAAFNECRTRSHPDGLVTRSVVERLKPAQLVHLCET
jgi:putative transposase